MKGFNLIILMMNYRDDINLLNENYKASVLHNVLTYDELDIKKSMKG